MPGSRTASQSSRVLLGALTSTRPAPASRCAWAPARVVARPVQSSTTSTPRAAQSGVVCRASIQLIVASPMTRPSASALTGSRQRP